MSGLDGVHASLVRILANAQVEPSMWLFNHTLVNGIPFDWKKADAVPLYKMGDAKEVENFRPVKITSVVCKA